MASFSSSSKRKIQEISPPMTGPWRITERLSDVTYRIHMWFDCLGLVLPGGSHVIPRCTLH